MYAVDTNYKEVSDGQCYLRTPDSPRIPSIPTSYPNPNPNPTLHHPLFRGSFHSIVATHHTVRRILSQHYMYVTLSRGSFHSIVHVQYSYTTHCPEDPFKVNSYIIHCLEDPLTELYVSILSKYTSTSLTVQRILSYVATML